MRKVVLNISKLGLVIGNIVNIKLIDSVGNIYVSPSGYAKDLNITLSADLLEIDLLENELIPYLTNYKITLPNALHFNFKVPLSHKALVESHDLLSLLSLGCVYGIIDQGSNSLDAGFIEKLNLYFTGENPHFSATQKDVVRLYEYYADEVIATNYTIDVIELIPAIELRFQQIHC